MKKLSGLLDTRWQSWIEHKYVSVSVIRLFGLEHGLTFVRYYEHTLKFS